MSIIERIMNIRTTLISMKTAMKKRRRMTEEKKGKWMNMSKMNKLMKTRVVTMHRDTWAGDTRIVSRPKYRDTYRDTYRDQCIAIRITIPQAAHHVMSTLRDKACIAIRVSIPPLAARRSI